MGETPKKIPKRLQNLRPPWKPGESGNPKGRPKGALNKKTIFEMALKEIAESLGRGMDPDKVKVALVKRGFREGLGGNYPFWRDIMRALGLLEDETLKLKGAIKTETEQRLPTEEEKKRAREIEELIKKYVRGKS